MTNMSTPFFSEGVRRYLSHQIDQIMLRSDVRVNAQGDLHTTPIYSTLW